MLELVHTHLVLLLDAFFGVHLQDDRCQELLQAGRAALVHVALQAAGVVPGYVPQPGNTHNSNEIFGLCASTRANASTHGTSWHQPIEALL